MHFGQCALSIRNISHAYHKFTVFSEVCAGEGGNSGSDRQEGLVKITATFSGFFRNAGFRG